jgi:hypothetical protein
MLDPPPLPPGHGAIVDTWEPDLAWLRGDAGYRVASRA